MLDVSEGKEWAGQLAQNGWEQGSIFAPLPALIQQIPEFIEFKEGQLLVVCTQTCSLLSQNFQKDPVVELLVADPIEKYNLKAPRAKGRENNNFHMPFASGSILYEKFEALDCCISKRFFLERNILCEISPINVDITMETLKSFKGWLANYYIRVALPDNLVERLKMGNKSSFKNNIAKILKKNDNNGKPYHEGVRTFYVSWSPNSEEQKLSSPYKINLRVICDNPNIEDDLQNEFDKSLEDYKEGIKNGISLENIDVSSLDNTTLALIDGMFRFNFWDDISDIQQRTNGYKLD